MRLLWIVGLALCIFCQVSHAIHIRIQTPGKEDTPVGFLNGDFEADSLADSKLGYEFIIPSEWRREGTTAVAANGNDEMGGLTSYSGDNYCVIRLGGSYVEQTLTGLETNTKYRVSFLSARMPSNYSAAETEEKLIVKVDGEIIKTQFPPPEIFELETAAFTADHDEVILRFENDSPEDGDWSILLDNIQVTKLVDTTPDWTRHLTSSCAEPISGKFGMFITGDVCRQQCTDLGELCAGYSMCEQQCTLCQPGGEYTTNLSNCTVYSKQECEALTKETCLPEQGSCIFLPNEAQCHSASVSCAKIQNQNDCTGEGQDIEWDGISRKIALRCEWDYTEGCIDRPSPVTHTLNGEYKLEAVTPDGFRGVLQSLDAGAGLTDTDDLSDTDGGNPLSLTKNTWDECVAHDCTFAITALVNRGENIYQIQVSSRHEEKGLVYAWQDTESLEGDRSQLTVSKTEQDCDSYACAFVILPVKDKPNTYTINLLIPNPDGGSPSKGIVSSEGLNLGLSEGLKVVALPYSYDDCPVDTNCEFTITPVTDPVASFSYKIQIKVPSTNEFHLWGYSLYRDDACSTELEYVTDGQASSTKEGGVTRANEILTVPESEPWSPAENESGEYAQVYATGIARSIRLTTGSDMNPQPTLEILKDLTVLRTFTSNELEITATMPTSRDGACLSLDPITTAPPVLAMVITTDDNTFAYANETVWGANAAPFHTSNGNQLTEAFFSVKIDGIMMTVGDVTHVITLQPQDQGKYTLQQLTIGSGKLAQSKAWSGSVDDVWGLGERGAARQICTEFGFNFDSYTGTEDHARSRLGYATSQDAACDIPESAEGIGLQNQITPSSLNSGRIQSSGEKNNFVSAVVKVVPTRVDECALGEHNCDIEHATCTDTVQSFICECNEGYEGSGVECSDTDECQVDNGGCDELTECTNTLGSRECGVCPEGYFGDGYEGCRDIDECVDENGGCDSRVECTNTPGSFTCADCPPGYAGDSSVPGGCQDVDECLEANGGCHPLQECINVEGSRLCGPCPPDAPTDCVNVNPCEYDNGGCDDLVKCHGEPGKLKCGACPLGYLGTGKYKGSCKQLAPILEKVAEETAQATLERLRPVIKVTKTTHDQFREDQRLGQQMHKLGTKVISAGLHAPFSEVSLTEHPDSIADSSENNVLSGDISNSNSENDANLEALLQRLEQTSPPLPTNSLQPF